MKSYLKRRIIILIFALFIAGLVGTITGVIDHSKLARTDIDFNEMTNYDLKDGMFVGGRVYEIYDEFAYEETYDETFGQKHNERVTSHYYVVPVLSSFDTDNPMYVAVEISHVDIVPQAEKLMQQTWDYYEKGIEPAVWNEFDIVGKLYPLEGELDSLFYEWYSYGDASVTRADYEQHVCPWVIKYYSVSGHSSSLVLFVALMIIGGLGIGVMVFMYLRSRNTSVPVASNPYTGNTYTGGSANNDDRPMPPDSGTDYWGSQPAASADDDRPLPPDSGASYWGSAPEQNTADATGGTMGYAEKSSAAEEMPSVSSLYQETNTLNNDDTNQ